MIDLFELDFRALFGFLFTLFLDETITQPAEHLRMNLKHQISLLDVAFGPVVVDTHLRKKNLRLELVGLPYPDYLLDQSKSTSFTTESSVDSQRSRAESN